MTFQFILNFFEKIHENFDFYDFLSILWFICFFITLYLLIRTSREKS